jgi:hypothetical protein
MKIQKATGVNACAESLVSRMMRGVRGAMDELPEDLRLAVWFSLCMKFGSAEAANIVQVPEAGIAQLVECGIDRMQTALARRGLIMDDISLRSALSALSWERASPAAVRRVIPDRCRRNRCDRDASTKEVFDNGLLSGICKELGYIRSGRTNDEWN